MLNFVTELEKKNRQMSNHFNFFFKYRKKYKLINEKFDALQDNQDDPFVVYKRWHILLWSADEVSSIDAPHS